jgi:hypothetical protein
LKVVLDSNAVLSGLFFDGVPGRILWNAGLIEVVLSASILAEYRHAAAVLESKYGGSDFDSFAALLALDAHARRIGAPGHRRRSVWRGTSSMFLTFVGTAYRKEGERDGPQASKGAIPVRTCP